MPRSRLRLLSGGAGVKERALSVPASRRVRSLPRIQGALGLLLVLLGVSHVMADVYVLAGGDRVTGRTLAGGRTFRIQTPYGVILIPRTKVKRIIHDDGREEVLSTPPEVRPTTGTPTQPVHLILVVTGATFWQAWEATPQPHDTTLRLQVSLDEDVIANYIDPHLDPGDLSKAEVNTFDFIPEYLMLSPSEGVQLSPPEARPGRIVLRIDLPAERAGTRQLRLAYQVNRGSAAEPAWKDAVDTSVGVELRRDSPAFIQVHQARGDMEFSGLRHKRMKRVETFRIEARPQE